VLNQRFLKGVSLVIGLTLFLSAFFAVGSLAVPLKSSEEASSTVVMSQEPEFDNGTYVEWFQEQNSATDSWSQTRMNWLFGPTTSFKVFHENETLISKNHYAEIDEKLNFSVVVPKSILPYGSELGMVMFYGQSAGYSMTEADLFLMAFAPGESALSVILGIGFPDWVNASSPWYGIANKFNYTKAGETGSYVDTELLPNFMNLYTDECDNRTDDFNYYFDFIASFTNDTPRAFYRIGMMVFDNQWNQIASYNYASSEDIPGLAIGVPPSEAWTSSYGGTYTLQKVGLDGETLYSVSRGQDFLMRFNISGDTPEFVELGLEVPDELYVKVNQTGWHWEIVTEYGGWVYDDVQETYLWNDTIEIVFNDYVYSEYQEEVFTDAGTWDEIEVRRLNWNETHGWWVENVTTKAFRELKFVYNTSTDSFETRFGYEYWTYPSDTYNPDLREVKITVVEDVPSYQEVLYVLNTSLCSATQVGNEFVVEFGGRFTDKMPVTDQYSWHEWRMRVIGPNDRWYSPATQGQNPRQTQLEYELARRIIVESPVTIAKVLMADGTEPTGWMFQVDKEVEFQVLGRLQGGGPIAADIDGVIFNLRAWDSEWTETESQWTELNYEITFEMDGTPELRGFNNTRMQNWTYGIYWDWVYTSEEGWHYEYDEATGDEVWVYGEYMTWEWMEVEGWHWEHWYFNQETGEWQQEWLDERSKETEIPADFCTVRDFAWWTDGGDLYARFYVNTTQSVPETEYQWEFAFASNQWFYDYASDYGEHTTLAWDKEWVYSFEDPDHPANDTFVNRFTDELALFNNTLCGIEGVEYFKGEESPYIVIDDEKLPIKKREYYDPNSGDTYYDLFFYDRYDPDTDRAIYYYELVNDTKINVTFTESIYIYNVTLANDMTFLTAMDNGYWWYSGGTSYIYWIDLDGNLYQGDWFDYQAVSVEYYDKAELKNKTRYCYVRHGLNEILYLAEDWRWDSRTDSYFMTDVDGTYYELWYNELDGYYYANIDSSWQKVSWPERFYIGNYSGSDVMLVRWYIDRFWFHEKDGIKHEMPYPGANAKYSYQMDETETDGGKVPTIKSFTYQGKARTVYEIMGQYFVDISGTTYELYLFNYPYSTANDTEIWYPDVPGYTADVGTFDNSLMFTKVETTEFVDPWPWFIDPDYYLPLVNGTIWSVNQSLRLGMIYEYELDGKTFYSMQEYPGYFENETGWYHYYEAINGTHFQLEGWQLLPKQATYKIEAFENETTWEFEYDFMGSNYTFDHWDYVDVYKVLNATYSGDDLYIPLSGYYGYGFNDIYQFNYHSHLVNATASFEHIYRVRNVWGYELVYRPAPIDSVVYKNLWSIVIGTPKWGMWGVGLWDRNPDNGALDLDGDFATTDDQYYVLEAYTSTEWWNHTWDMLWVDVKWDPNRTVWGDEMRLDSWMGLNTFTWRYEWERRYYWYHADTRAPVTASEFDVINSTVNNEDGYPKAGYWDIAWMTKNVTYADYLAEAQAQGWDWGTTNEQTWTTLSFGIEQRYGLTYRDPPYFHWTRVRMHYEFSGLLVWDDSNQNMEMDVNPNRPGSGELSHYFIPDSVDDVSFVTPGTSFGDPSPSGQMRVELDDEVVWGVTFTDINGTTYPYNEFGWWGWYERLLRGSDMRSFDERPTDVSIDELSFLVHFQGHLDETEGAINNNVTFKVDNYVGNWEVDMLGGRENLENKSLALNYLAEVHMRDFAFKAGRVLSHAHTTASADDFQFETAGEQFAEMIMGGTTYDWSKNMTAPYNVTSHTTPIATFVTAYQGGHGRTCFAWNFTDTMFYVTIGFPQWDGYSVYQDPVFVAYSSSIGTSPLQFGALSIESGDPIEGEAVTIGVDIISEVAVDTVDLLYSTDMTTWTSVEMASTTSTHWVGDIPSHPEDTEVFYKVVAHAGTYGDYESGTFSYIVGQTIVTTTTTTTTPPLTTPTTTPIGEWPLEIVVMVVGGAFVLLLLAMIARRRKQ
jgi:hypothetical protein